MNAVKQLLLVLSVVLLSGCATSYRPPVVRARHAVPRNPIPGNRGKPGRAEPSHRPRRRAVGFPTVSPAIDGEIGFDFDPSRARSGRFPGRNQPPRARYVSEADESRGHPSPKLEQKSG